MSAAISIVEDNYFTEAIRFVPQLAPVMSSASASPRLNRTRKAERAEEDLVERLRSGDEKALEEVFDRFAPKLYNVAHRILGEVGDAEEVIQDVFWTAFRKAGTFRGSARFSTWLYRLTINAALGKLRRRKGNQEIEYDEYLPKFQRDGHHRVRPVVDWSDTLDERYAKREVQQILKEALDQLRPMDKSVVVLSDLEGISDKEIAEMVGLTVSAVKTRLHRARLCLRGTLAVRLGHSPA
jgi:RNA polymerase sigma-70 factor, ECF subfamily